MHPSDMARDSCPEDYSPCTCVANGPSALYVTCTNASIEEIQDVFYRTRTVDLYRVELFLTRSMSGTTHLPADLLQDKRAQEILMFCPVDAEPKLGLTFDPAAFEFSRFNTNYFALDGCDLASQTDMLFLNDFSILDTLILYRVDNIGSVSTLPTFTLPALKIFAIMNCTGLQNVTFPDLTPATLEQLVVQRSHLDDSTVNDILVSVGSSSSASSLWAISLEANALTKLPRIAAFSKLVYYDVSSNVIPYISQSSLVFSDPVFSLDLSNNSITAIEGGAFLDT
ncbi:uncharacterized protein LOC130702954 [Daphnia carinata]|uniref:uncharacterized protein LOC130702954 n=1 Tax=Daphnia carinata TaxID=120202 RepID=UPI002868C9D9|nr:uncharacterized protein LOC130702954 [Daphnia carinata]